MDNLMIRTEGLSRSFGESIAVDRLDLAVGKGELYGLVGPDGAGKTTTLRLLSGIVSPSSGEAWIAGRALTADPEALRPLIGYMSQRFGLYEDLTVIENILFYADLYEVPRTERQQRIDRLLGFSNLTPFRDRLAGALSGGMKQKLGLACALVHTPALLLLDEPTNGVDPVSRRDFWRILYDLLREGVTILLSTSYLDEAERCARIGLMHRGRILVEDEPRRVRASLDRPMLEIWTENGREAGERVRSLPGVIAASLYGDRVHVTLADRSVADGIVAALRSQGVVIRDQREILPSLEDVFISLVA